MFVEMYIFSLTGWLALFSPNLYFDNRATAKTHVRIVIFSYGIEVIERAKDS